MLPVSYQAFSSVDVRVIYRGHRDCYPVFFREETRGAGCRSDLVEVTRNKSAPFSTPVSSQLTQPLGNNPQPWRHLTLLPGPAALVRV